MGQGDGQGRLGARKPGDLPWFDTFGKIPETNPDAILFLYKYCGKGIF
jgi:hypothetical protein